jgi:hypothetical protein
MTFNTKLEGRSAACATIAKKSVNLLQNHLKGNKMKSGWITASSPIPLYRSRILPVVLYGRGTWSLTLREEYRLRVSKNRVFRKLLGH